MIRRFVGASVRAICVLALVTAPALLLPGQSPSSGLMIPLIALIAAAFTFMEYATDYPSFVEFRDAPPFNRLRFGSLFAVVALTAIVCADAIEPTLFTGAMFSLGLFLGEMADFPYSPVRLLLIALAETAPVSFLEIALSAAGLALLVSLTTLAVFALLIRVLNWPLQSGAFNVWVNMPLFDPTSGGDVLLRLRRDARLNVAMGFLVPFVLPALVALAGAVLGPLYFGDPHTLIWMMSVWAFLPTSMIMRGIALHRVADLVEEKRRRTYGELAAA